MKKIMISVVFLSMKLFGMSEADYQVASQERNERIVQARFALAPKQGERSALEANVGSAESSLSGLKTFLHQEKNAYDEACRKLHEDIVRYDPALIPSLLAEQLRTKESSLNARYEQARQKHEQKGAYYDDKRRKCTEQKAALLAEISKWQDVERNQPETLRKLQVYIALFMRRVQGTDTSLVQAAPPEYSELPGHVLVDGVPSYQAPNYTGASTSYGTFLPSAPPAYDEITLEEK